MLSRDSSSIMLQTDPGTSEKSTAVLSQLRLVDAKRLRRLIGYVSEEDIVLLKEKLKGLIP